MSKGGFGERKSTSQASSDGGPAAALASLNHSRQLQVDDATLKKRATNKQIHIIDSITIQDKRKLAPIVNPPSSRHTPVS
jgi:hypothetical protein